MIVFKMALTFFFMFLIAFIVSLIGMPSDDYGRNKGVAEERAKWRMWAIRSGLATAFFFWLAIAGLIWH